MRPFWYFWMFLSKLITFLVDITPLHHPLTTFWLAVVVVNHKFKTSLLGRYFLPVLQKREYLPILSKGRI
jgi:hypothetical protein